MVHKLSIEISELHGSFDDRGGSISMAGRAKRAPFLPEAFEGVEANEVNLTLSLSM